MPPQRPTITYTAPASFLSTDHWKQVHAALVSQLPLRNLHWKSTSRPTIRTIQELDVEFVAAETRRDEATSQIPQTVLEKTLMSVYIVVCEVSRSIPCYGLESLMCYLKDADTYKNTVKKQIKDWHTAVTQRKNHEWLVVHIVRPDSKTGASKLFQLRSSVLDKIKADFNSDKRDRFVFLCSRGADNPWHKLDACSWCGPMMMTTQLLGRNWSTKSKTGCSQHSTQPLFRGKRKLNGPRDNGRCPDGISAHSSY